MQGYCPYLIYGLKSIIDCQAPQAKITPGGFLQMLLAANSPVRISNMDSLLLQSNDGHYRDIRIKYLKRTVPGQTRTVDDCGVDVLNTYQEAAVPTNLYRALSIYMDYDTFARYCQDASVLMNKPGSPTALMMEIWDQIITAANGLIGAIDIDLLTKQLTNFGANVAYGGSTAAQTVAFPGLTNNTNFYTQGLTKILQDASLNEVCGNLAIVGQGNFNAFTLQQAAACCAANGMDISKFTGFTYYQDIYSQTVWGANHIGVFAPGSVGLTQINRYVGNFAGKRGNAEYWNMPLPLDCLDCNGNYADLNFDMQLRFTDCPTTIDTACGEQTVGRGVIIDISKAFDLFNIPTDTYQHTAYGDCYNDRMAGNNGTLHYIITTA